MALQSRPDTANGGVREFLQTPAGTGVAIGATVVLVAVMVWVVIGSLGGSTAAALSRDRTFVDADTGKPFEHTLTVGETLPVAVPATGKKSGYPAELCYWTADGKVKQDPTPVLLNEYVGKEGPTFCPDCGRLVVGHNPKPEAGDTKPPPTEAQMTARR